MCGRYYVEDETAKEIERLVKSLEKKTLPSLKKGDVYPAQAAAVIRAAGREIEAGEMLWGFPRYKGSGLLINARAETITERRTFRESVLRRRCVILARHFYEWNREKEKALFFHKSRPVLYMAGCYQRFEEKERFVIITTEANASVKRVHDRMPLLLQKEELKPWLLEDMAVPLLLKKTPEDLECRMEYEQRRLPL